MDKFPKVGNGVKLGMVSYVPACATLSKSQHVDWVEIAPENLFCANNDILDAISNLRERKPLVFHCVSLSLARADKIDMRPYTAIRSLIHEFKPLWVSDHLSFSSAHGRNFHALCPVPRNDESLNLIVDQIKFAQDYFGLRFAVENPTFYFEPPGSTMSELEFILSILDATSVDFILDLQNIVCNIVNLSVPSVIDKSEIIAKAKTFIDKFPLERVIETHVAGGVEVTVKNRKLLSDTHGNDVGEIVIELLRYLRGKVPGVNVLLEREYNSPTVNQIIEELAKIDARTAPDVGFTWQECKSGSISKNVGGSQQRVL